MVTAVPAGGATNAAGSVTTSMRGRLVKAAGRPADNSSVGARPWVVAVVLAAVLPACGGGGTPKACSNVNAALAALVPTPPGRPLDPLEDVLPTAAEGFEGALNAPVAPGDRNLHPWVRAGLAAGGATEGYTAMFSRGTGAGWSAYAFRAADADRAARSTYTALVCAYHGVPWSPAGQPGAVAASR